MSHLSDICLFLFAVVQTLAAVFAIYDRQQWKAIGRSTGLHVGVAALLIIGALGATGVGAYAWGHPVKPREVVRTVTVEKTVPCPPARTGNASSRGNNGIAHSGSGDTFVSTPTETKK